jgi:zinc protease
VLRALSLESTVNRLRFLTAIVTATCCATPAMRATGQQARFNSTLHRLRLENGLQVIVAENHRLPLATILVAVRNGAITQDSGDQGLAHLYEHLLFRSYKGDPDAFAAEASDLDAESNGTAYIGNTTRMEGHS